MQQCWNDNPKSRPTFQQITSTIELLVGSNAMTNAAAAQPSDTGGIPPVHQTKGRNLYQTLPRASIYSPESGPDSGETHVLVECVSPPENNDPSIDQPDYFTVNTATPTAPSHENQVPAVDQPDYFTVNSATPTAPSRENSVPNNEDQPDYFTLNSDAQPEPDARAAVTPFAPPNDPNSASESDPYCTLNPDVQRERDDEGKKSNSTPKVPGSNLDQDPGSYVSLAKPAPEYTKVSKPTPAVRTNPPVPKEDPAMNDDMTHSYFMLERMKQPKANSDKIRHEPDLTSDGVGINSNAESVI